jgi:hypothetical protein
MERILFHPRDDENKRELKWKRGGSVEDTKCPI